MTKRYFLFSLIIYAIVYGCSYYEASTPRTFLEGDNDANYERIFDHQKPQNIEIVNSIVIDYQWRPGVVTTDDWEFELFAPKSWMDEQMSKWNLRKAEDSYIVKIMEERKNNPIRDWYSPKDIKAYNLYCLHVTSIPYIHMLVEKDFKKDEKYHIFISKH